MSDIEQIRRAHASARPNTQNPAWMNCHHDCGVLLAEIERLRRELSQWEKQTQGQVWIPSDEYAALCKLKQESHG